jgi:hypothetical protein
MCAWWIPFVIISLPLAYWISRKYQHGTRKSIGVAIAIVIGLYIIIAMFLDAAGVINITP